VEQRFSPSERPRPSPALLEDELRDLACPRFSPAERLPEAHSERATAVLRFEREDGPARSLIAGVRVESMARA
jgi:hypothetical protein